MQTRLRYWEYYGMTETFDGLYEKSKNGILFQPSLRHHHIERKYPTCLSHNQNK